MSVCVCDHRLTELAGFLCWFWGFFGRIQSSEGRSDLSWQLLVVCP